MEKSKAVGLGIVPEPRAQVLGQAGTGRCPEQWYQGSLEAGRQGVPGWGPGWQPRLSHASAWVPGDFSPSPQLPLGVAMEEKFRAGLGRPVGPRRPPLTSPSPSLSLSRSIMPRPVS